MWYSYGRIESQPQLTRTHATHLLPTFVIHQINALVKKTTPGDDFEIACSKAVAATILLHDVSYSYEKALVPTLPPLSRLVFAIFTKLWRTWLISEIRATPCASIPESLTRERHAGTDRSYPCTRPSGCHLPVTLHLQPRYHSGEL